MDTFFTADILTDWVKLILLSNIFNAQVLWSIVSHAWTVLIHRFCTTVEFDEFDSTFCE